MSAKLLVFLGLICLGKLASGVSVLQPQPSSRVLFAADLFKQVAKDKLNENVIISPISVQAAMAMVFMGAEGKTAIELQRGLRLSSSNKDLVGQEFSEVLKAKKGEEQLKIANKLYAQAGYSLRLTYNDLLSKYFNSEAETVNFAQQAAITNINNWVAKATNDKIKEIVTPGIVGMRTSAVIVNAIYFKGIWDSMFLPYFTEYKPFWVSKTDSIDTAMMYQNSKLMFGDFPELGASGVVLPYQNSDLSMLILLPYERDGLAALEEKLGSVALTELPARMKKQGVMVRLPKFTIEFSTSMNNALEALGIKSIFENDANLSGIFDGRSVQLSKVQHKAYIDVNEEGSEASASTMAGTFLMAPIRYPKNFNADHPFVYAIQSADTVYFVGHFSQPKK